MTPAIGQAGNELLSFAKTAAIAGGIFSAGALGINSIKDYEVALASLEAVTGQASSKYKQQIESIANVSKKSAIDVTKSFEIVGSAMSQYLSDPKALGLITDAGITLSKASKMELTPALEALTSVMNQFKIPAEGALDTINRLTAGEIVGSVSTQKIAESLQEFGANAYTANVKLSESVALLETLGKQMDHSKIGIGARNILNVLASAKGLDKQAIESLNQHGVNLQLLMDKSKPLAVRLTELSKIQNDAVAVTRVFGKENMTAANVVFQNLDTYKQYAAAIETTNKANEQARVNSDTFANAMVELKNSFINTVVSSGQLGDGMSKLKGVLQFLARNMSTIVEVGVKILMFFAAWKAINLATTAVIAAYNIALGIQGALTGVVSVAVGQSTIALGAYKIMTGLVTAATWLWNSAQTALNFVLSMNPIGLVILAIAALVAAIVWVSRNTEGWGETWSSVMGWMSSVFDMFYFAVKSNLLGIEHSFLAMTDAIVKAWYWTQNKLGFLSDEQYNKNISLIEKESSARVAAIREATQATRNAAVKASQGIDWQVRMKADEPVSDKQPLNQRKAEQQAMVMQMKNDPSRSQIDLNLLSPRLEAATSAPNVNVKTSRSSGGWGQ